MSRQTKPADFSRTQAPEEDWLDSLPLDPD